MLPRAAVRQATRLQASSIASSSRLSARHLSSGLTRPSAVALGKRPEVLCGSRSGSSLGVRHLSWSPWTKPPPAPVPSEPVPDPQPPIVEGAASSSQTTQPLSDIPTTSVSTHSAPVDVTAPASATGGSPVSSAASDAASPVLEVVREAAAPIRTVPNASLTEVITLNPEVPLDELLRTPEAIAAACKKADLHTLGMDHMFINTAGWTRDILVSIHEYAHLPWWATIVALTCVIRAFLIPLTISGMKAAAKMKAVGPQMRALQTKMQEAIKEEKQVDAQMYSTAIRNLKDKHDIKLGSLFWRPVTQLVIFLSVFNGLRGLAEKPIPQFFVGGFGWVTDLTVPDPYYILPMSSVILTNLVLRVGADGQAAVGEGTGAAFAQHIRNLVAFASVPMFFLIWQYPAALLFYWTTTNTFTLVQAFILSRPAVKNYLNLPKPEILPVPPQYADREKPSLAQTFKWAVNGVVDAVNKLKEGGATTTAEAQTRATQQGAAAANRKMQRDIIREKKI